MAKIYLVRHGESIANSEGIYQGQTYDTDLSLRGQTQASKLVNYFNDKNLNRIIASPLKRTIQTATVVSNKFNLELMIERKIIETSHGDWEGKRKDLIIKTWPRVYQNWITRPIDTVFPGGEKFMETKERTVFWWNEIKKLSGNTLVVTHDNIIRIILAEVSGQDTNSIWDFDILPTGISTIDVEKGVVKIVKINETGHLSKGDKDITNHAL